MEPKIERRIILAVAWAAILSNALSSLEWVMSSQTLISNRKLSMLVTYKI